jgi:hypothetical protein
MNIKEHMKYLPALIAFLILAAPALAVNNPPPNKVEKLKLSAVLESIEKEKAEARQAARKDLEKELTPLEKQWGIKLYGVRWTAAGYMLEMKFRVLDPEKAFPLLKRDAKRYLLVEKSGAMLEVPFTQKLGSLKSSVRTANMVQADRNYIALFANPGKHVAQGDKVTLVIGSFMAEHLHVR